MSERTKGPRLARLGFLGVGAAAVAGAGLGVGIVAGPGSVRASFDVTDGFPDRPVNIHVAAQALPDGVEVSGVLTVRTPTETVTVDIPAVALKAGQATIPVTLVYPYDTRVPGTYSYSASLDVGGRRVITQAPAVYDVRRIVWFS